VIVSDVVAITGAVVTPLTLLGGGVAWIVARLDNLDKKVKDANDKAQKAENSVNRLLLQLQRWRTAFQIVATELQRRDPENPTLHLARSILVEIPADFDTPPDMADKLAQMKQEELRFD
jgi:hypothetical protein